MEAVDLVTGMVIQQPIRESRTYPGLATPDSCDCL